MKLEIRKWKLEKRLPETRRPKFETGKLARG
jgi:hypothetical protein